MSAGLAINQCTEFEVVTSSGSRATRPATRQERGYRRALTRSALTRLARLSKVLTCLVP